MGVVGIGGDQGDATQCWCLGIKNHLGVIVGCRDRRTLIACKVQNLDAEGSIAVLAGQDGSTDFPDLPSVSILLEFQGVQPIDADIRTGQSLDWFRGAETLRLRWFPWRWYYPGCWK